MFYLNSRKFGSPMFAQKPLSEHKILKVIEKDKDETEGASETTTRENMSD